FFLFGLGLVDPLCFLDSLEYDTLTHGYTEWFIPNYKRAVVSVLVSCVQSNIISHN
ncbi:unnamed protein product, partial [Brassica oleracea var. botrytis]